MNRTPKVGQFKVRIKLSFESGIVPGSFLFLFEVVHVPERVRVEKFRLHYPEEVLHHGVVQAVSLAAHALDDVVVLQRFLVAVMLVMPALVGVQH